MKTETKGARITARNNETLEILYTECAENKAQLIDIHPGGGKYSRWWTPDEECPCINTLEETTNE